MVYHSTTSLHCTVVKYTKLYWIQYYTILYYTILYYYNILYHAILCHAVLYIYIYCAKPQISYYANVQKASMRLPEACLCFR